MNSTPSAHLSAVLYTQIRGHARRSNPFYARWIPPNGIPPVLDRRTALEHNDEILNGAIPTGTTSGSIGVPFRYAHSPDWTRRAARDLYMFVAELGGPLPTVQILPTRHGPVPPLFVSVSTPVEEQLAFILRHRDTSWVTAITTLPTNAEMLAELVLERGIETSFVTRFGTMSETLQDYQRDRIKRAFPNAKLWSTYSSLEFGFIATSCPHVEGYYHVMSHRLGVEILRDDGTPVQPGEPGQIYVTDYYNRLAPLIRYELGDIVQAAECPCGRWDGMALGRIHGRVAGTITLRDGSRMLSANLSVDIRETPGVRQYQIVQNDIEDMTIKLVSDSNHDERMRALVQDHLGYRPHRLQIDYVAEIPRGPGGKLRTTINNVARMNGAS